MRARWTARALAASASALAASTLAACGEDEAASDPGDFVPAGAPIYLEASLASEDQVANAEALIDELGEVPVLGSTLDPSELIADAIDESFADEDIDASYAEDIEPWLGERGAIAFFSFEGFESSEGSTINVANTVGSDTGSGSEPTDFVAIVETSDDDTARDSIERLVSLEPDGHFEEGEIAGEPALRDTETGSGGFVFADGFVLAGPSDEALEEALEARDGETLPESEQFEQAQEGLAEERLGFGYVDVAAAIDYAVDSGADAQDIEVVEALYGDALESPLSMAVVAEERHASLEFGSGFTEFGLPGAGVAAAAGDAPADAFATVGLGDLGAQVELVLEQVGEVGEATGDPEADPEAIAAAFEEATGISLDDATAAVGETSVWVRGDLPRDYAVGIEASVDGRSETPARLLDALGEAISSDGLFRLGPPLSGSDAGFSATTDQLFASQSEIGFVNAELDGDRLAIVVGSDRDQVAKPASGALAESPGFADAEGALGEDYELNTYVDLGPILDFAVEQSSPLDVVTGDATPDEVVLDYLSGKLGYAAAGTREVGDRLIQRLVVGLE